MLLTDMQENNLNMGARKKEASLLSPLWGWLYDQNSA